MEEFEYRVGFDWSAALADTAAALQQFEALFSQFNPGAVGSAITPTLPTGVVGQALTPGTADLRTTEGLTRSVDQFRNIASDLRSQINYTDPNQVRLLEAAERQARSLGEAARTLRGDRGPLGPNGIEVQRIPIEEVARYRAPGPLPRYDETTPEFARLLDDVRRNGIRDPLQINTSGGQADLEDGYHRLAAAQALGLRELPVQVYDVDRQGRVLPTGGIDAARFNYDRENGTNFRGEIAEAERRRLAELNRPIVIPPQPPIFDAEDFPRQVSDREVQDTIDRGLAARREREAARQAQETDAAKREAAAARQATYTGQIPRDPRALHNDDDAEVQARRRAADAEQRARQKMRDSGIDIDALAPPRPTDPARFVVQPQGDTLHERDQAANERGRAILADRDDERAWRSLSRDEQEAQLRDADATATLLQQQVEIEREIAEKQANRREVMRQASTRGGGGGDVPPRTPGGPGGPDDPFGPVNVDGNGDVPWNPRDVAQARREKAEKERRVAALMMPGGDFEDIPLREGQNRGQTEARNARRDLAEQIELDATDDFVQNKAQSAAAERRRTAAIQQATAEELSRSGNEEIASSLVAREVRSLQERLSVTRQTLQMEERGLSADQRIIGLKAQIAVENQKLQAATRAAAQQAFREAGGYNEGTRFQRVQASLHTRRTGELRSPLQEQTLGQFAGQRLVQSAGFALSGALLYGGVQAISSMVKEAEELERILNQVEAQFNSADEAADFPRFREAILEIGRETGQATDEVAFVAFQLKGAFQDSEEAILATRQAIELTRVTGLELKEVVDSLTAISMSFEDTGVSIEDIGDKALGLQERFGVLARETITFAADLAPVAAQMGFTSAQLEALGATAQKYSGRSGSQLAEAFGRIFPSIQENAAQFVGIFRQIPALQQAAGEAATTLATGDISGFFTLLLNNYSKLTEAQQNYMLDILGGRRETQALVGVLEHADELLGEFSGQFNDAGKQAAYFADYQQTVSQQLAELIERGKQLGVALFEAGLADILKDALVAGQGLATIFTTIVDVLGALNDATGGWLLRIGEIVAAMKVIRALSQAELAQGFLGRLGLAGGTAGLLGSIGARSVADAAAGNIVPMGVAEATRGGYRGTVAELAGDGVAGAAGGAIGQMTIREGYRAGVARVAGQGGGKILSAGTRGTLSGIGGATAASGLGPGIIVGSVVATGVTYANERADVQQQEQSLIEIIKSADKERLEEIGEIKSSMWERIGYAVFGVTDPETTRQNELRGSRLNSDSRQMELQLRSYQENYGHLFDQDGILPGTAAAEVEFEQLRAGVDGADKYSNLTELADGVAKGEKAAVEFASVYIDHLKGDPTDKQHLANSLKIAEAEIRAADEEARSKAERERLTAAAGNELQAGLLSAGQARELFGAGQIGVAEYLSAIDANIGDYIALQNAGGLTPQQQQQLATLMKERSGAFSNAARREYDFQQRMAQVGGRNDPGGDAQRLVALLNNSEFTNTDDRAKATDDILKALNAELELQASMVDTESERLAILNRGITIPEEVRTELIFQQLNSIDLGFQRFLLGTSPQFRSLTGITQRASEIIALTGASVQDATLLAMREQEAALVQTVTNLEMIGSMPDQLAHFQGLLTAVRAAIADVEGGALGDVTVDAPGQVKGDEAALKKQNAENAERRVRSIRNLAAVRAGNDPLIQAENDLADAREDLAKAAPDTAEWYDAKAKQEAATQAIAAARAEEAQAARDLSATRSGSPVEAAAAQQAAADDAMRLARNATERLRAQAQRVEADRAMAEAIADVSAAQNELAIAVAEAAGDSVTAAELGLEQARRDLDRVKNLTPGDEAAITRAQADVVRSEANLAETRSRTAQEDIDFQLDMEQITVGQAIAAYQALLAAETNEDRRRDLQRTIKGLQDELGQDLQFNLPTELNLPTLYEARRLNQTPGGGGYQDNRNVNINVVVNNGTDAQQMMQAFSDALGQRRYGTTPRNY